MPVGWHVEDGAGLPARPVLQAAEHVCPARVPVVHAKVPPVGCGGLPEHVLKHDPLMAQAPERVHMAEIGPTKPVEHVPAQVVFTREVVEHDENVALGALGAVEQTAGRQQSRKNNPQHVRSQNMVRVHITDCIMSRRRWSHDRQHHFRCLIACSGSEKILCLGLP